MEAAETSDTGFLSDGEKKKIQMKSIENFLADFKLRRPILYDAAFLAAAIVLVTLGVIAHEGLDGHPLLLNLFDGQ